jgi:N-terminal region of Chorein or VPS13
MESLLLSIISQYLKDYVNNFKRDQVSLNFLRGQGVIRNLDINVAAINEAIFQSSIPALRFTRIMINTLSVEAPIMNLKNKPITFFIDRLFIEIAEVVDIEKRPPKKTPKKAASAKYGFIDRVLDCLSFEINRTTIAIQTLGRMKTTTVGPWTPPVLLIELSGARVFCTNHNGLETELDECLRIRPTKRPLLFLYKKLEVEKASFHLINPELWVTIAEELLKDVSVAHLSGLDLKSGTRGFVKLKIFNNIPLQVMMSMRKRIDNNFLLGLELAITLEAVKINLRKQCLSELLHFLMGMHFCLFRLDSIQELFGQDPYSEGFTSSSVGVGSAGLSRTPTAGTAAAVTDRRNRRRAQFGQAENESLDRLEAEMITGGAVVADEDERAEDWHRSSLNSDDDPPHMRFVTVIQVSDATITFHLDDNDPLTDKKSVVISITDEPPAIPSNSASAHKDTRITSLPVAVILSFQGLVHTTVSPEHAAATESVIQTTLKSLALTGDTLLSPWCGVNCGLKVLKI